MIQPSTPQKDREITIRDLYPALGERELLNAEEHLARYIEIVIEIRRRVAASALVDRPDPGSIITEERSNRSHKT